ncbi:MAG TPA: hypothetical protein PJ994_03500 [Tepidiformaceae bacterium]|nr:hypothetical protein [Tepidiformaceae bacterium]
MLTDVWSLRIDDVVVFDDGSAAVVVAPPQDAEWVATRYVASPETWLVGESDLTHVSEIAAVIPVHVN